MSHSVQTRCESTDWINRGNMTIEQAMIAHAKEFGRNEVEARLAQSTYPVWRGTVVEKSVFTVEGLRGGE